MSLTDLVKTRLASLGEERPMDCRIDALRRASELADLFDFVTPNESTIPLDAIAGFPNHQTDKKKFHDSALVATA